jgi:hypothetical protein
MLGSVNSQATLYEGSDWTTNASTMKSPTNWFRASDFRTTGNRWSDRGNQGNDLTRYFGTITKVEVHPDSGKSSVNFAMNGSANPYIESQSNNNWMTGNFRGSYLIVAKAPSQA